MASIEIFVMAKITTTQIKKNSDDPIFLKDLPVGLKRKLAVILKLLQARQIEVNSGDVLKSILVPTGTGANKILSEMENKVKEQARETLELLVWYFKQHFSSYHPQAIGSDVYCSDCKWLQSSIFEYCENPNCSSHEKWRAIMGPSYKPPKKEELPIQIFPSPISTQEELDAYVQQIRALRS